MLKDRIPVEYTQMQGNKKDSGLYSSKEERDSELK